MRHRPIATREEIILLLGCSTNLQTLGKYLTLAQKRNPIDGLVCLYWYASQPKN